MDKAGDNHICKGIYPWKGAVRVCVKLFGDSLVLHNGARRNNNVDNVTYVEFC